MLRSLNGMNGYNLKALDGEIGKIVDFYFDDLSWTIQYFVVDTGGWLSGRKVLISPVANSSEPDSENKVVPLVLTREMIEKSPDIERDKPVSRQKELEMMRHYRWPVYWNEPYSGDEGAIPLEYYEQVALSEKEEGDSHLRSAREVEGYRIHATDGEIGRVKDFIVDDKTWDVRYLVVDTGDWIPGRKVIIAPLWLKQVKWSTAEVFADLDKKSIEDSPEYDPAEPVNRDYEGRLYDYYGRPRYWK
ncbi:MAG: PRC-barrel domain containing protein [Candidatus Omnitrophica bacterium]|nr:PRC-barrel domain containing protein [Candidatus Omnitrophota bacterium]